jgi:hypothetical protein
MNKKTVTTLSAIGLALLALWSFRADAAPPNLITGERISLSAPPGWTYSGAWRDETLLLVDVLKDSVRAYTAEGRYVGDLPKTSKDGKPIFSNPTIIQESTGGQYWLEDNDGRFVLLDRALKAVGPVRNLKSAGSEGIRAVFQWVPAGEHLFVFGDIRRGDKAAGAFLWVPVANPEQFKVLATTAVIAVNEPARAVKDPAHVFYTLGLPFVASVNEKPWYLVMGDGEFPYVKGPGARKIYFTLPGKNGREMVRRPKLTEERGPSSSRTIFSQLEEAPLPSGIYGRHGALFILVRTPADRGRSTWSMMKIDPRTTRTLWHYPIDSTANHLVVVPGERYWAFIEKGPVESVGDQALDSFLRVPATVFDR